MSEETGLEEKPSELTEEQKLALKFPGKKPVATDILKKRMQRGVKYFDSGDYAMAKSEKKAGPAAAAIGNRGKLPMGVGKAIPTPDNIPHRKTSVPTDYHTRARSGEFNLVMDQ
ncbi:alpha-endosulfine-like [Stylophora pistillata]|uniref:alpha-endosulfine-like n=1 Tax=Stylophora pistillata TaxID=50429 RepID=UPI000C03EE96|nr:alpha-endosulfine-like [Stylophora pistillata]